jgi:hypothetical protein
MKKIGYWVVRVRVRRTNRGELFVLDNARRQADHFGRDGIRAKRGQTTTRYRRRGYIRMVFPTRALARKYVRRVERLDEPAVRCRLMRNPNRYPR